MRQVQLQLPRPRLLAAASRGLALVLLLAAGHPLLSSPCYADDDPEFVEAAPADAAQPSPSTAANDAPAAAGEDDDYPHCIVTKERWDTSSTRVEAIFRVDGVQMQGKFLSLTYMMIEYKLLKDDNHRVEIETVSVLDFPSFGTGAERMIPINDEWNNVAFLATESKLEGTRRPYFAAFSDAAQLEEAKKTLGGDVMTYEEVLKKLLKALKDPEVSVEETLEQSMRRPYKLQDWGAEE